MPGSRRARYPGHPRFHRRLPRIVPASQPVSPRLCAPSNGSGRFGSHRSALHDPSIATTASADFCAPVPKPLDFGSTQAGAQTSRGKTRDLHSMCLPHLHVVRSGDIGFGSRCPLAHRRRASHAIPVRQAGALPSASSPHRLTTYAVAVRLGIPVTKASRGLSPPSHFPVRFRLPVVRCPKTSRAMPGAQRRRAPEGALLARPESVLIRLPWRSSPRRSPS